MNIHYILSICLTALIASTASAYESQLWNMENDTVAFSDKTEAIEAGASVDTCDLSRLIEDQVANRKISEIAQSFTLVKVVLSTDSSISGVILFENGSQFFFLDEQRPGLLNSYSFSDENCCRNCIHNGKSNGCSCILFSNNICKMKTGCPLTANLTGNWSTLDLPKCYSSGRVYEKDYISAN